MEWQLDPQASFCIASGRAIFLHAGRDRYLALPEALNQMLLDWLRAPGDALPADLVSMLHPAGILVPAAKGASVPLKPYECSVARQALARDPRGAVGPAGIAAVGAAFWRTKRILRRHGFAGLLDRLATAIDTGISKTEVEAQARRFLCGKALLSVREDCLVDSLAMLSYLRRRGCAAEAVFGVTAVPFQAHCWVQSHGVLLNDVVDHVSAFTPILSR